MASGNVNYVVWALGLWLTITASAAAATRDIQMKPGDNLPARLEASGGLVECWNALLEIKSCSNAIVLFFLNGQTDVGVDCCRAIDTITHHCWPAMLTSLGFTAEEGNILRGYCDASSLDPAAAPSAVGYSPVQFQPEQKPVVLA